MMTRLLTSTCLCLFVLQAVGCNKSESAIARANGTPITQAQWDEYVKIKRLQLPGDEQTARALDEYATSVGLAGAIESEKVLDPLAIQAEVDAVKRQVLINRYFERYLENNVTEQDVQDYYDAHSSEFEDQTVHVAQILFRTSQRTTDSEIKAKRVAAQAAYEQLRGGKDFAEVATAVSEDPSSRKKGGDVGWLRAGGANNIIVQRAFKLKPGEFTEPIQSGLAFYIIKQLEPIKTVRRPVPQVQGTIRNQLRAAAKAAETARLMAKAQIEIHGKPRALTAETQVNTARADSK